VGSLSRKKDDHEKYRYIGLVTECKQRNYSTTKNKRTMQESIGN